MPSRARARCSTTSTAEASWLWAASRPRPAARASASTRAGTSTAELACRVPQPPSCPVLSAASSSTTSPPRTSPTTSRSGRIRSAWRTSVRRSMSPAPSTLAGRPSSADHVRVPGPQLAGVLDEHEPLVGVHQRQQRGQQRGLAGAGAAGDQERQPGGDDRLEQPHPLGRQRPGVLQLRQREAAGPRHPQREQRAGPGDRGEHGVEAGAVGQPEVDVRRGVVEPASTGGGQPLREPAHRGLVGEPDVGALQPRAAVEVDRSRDR